MKITLTLHIKRSKPRKATDEPQVTTSPTPNYPGNTPPATSTPTTDPATTGTGSA